MDMSNRYFLGRVNWRYILSIHVPQKVRMAVDKMPVGAPLRQQFMGRVNDVDRGGRSRAPNRDAERGLDDGNMFCRPIDALPGAGT